VLLKLFSSLQDQVSLDPEQFYNFFNTKLKSSSYPSSLKFEKSGASRP